MLKSFSMSELMKMAYHEASYSTCVSRQVGCVIQVNDMADTFLGGYNERVDNTTCEKGRACRCFSTYEPGKDLDKVLAIHAEAMAIAAAAKHGVSVKDGTIIVTDLPCTECAKLIIHSGIKRVYYDREYPSSQSKRLFQAAGVSCVAIQKELCEV